MRRASTTRRTRSTTTATRGWTAIAARGSRPGTAGVVTLVDLAARVCPGGPPCPDEVERGAHPARRPALHAGGRRDPGPVAHPADRCRWCDTAETLGSRSRTESVSRRAPLGAPAYLPALMIAIGGWQHRWMDEDAFINYRSSTRSSPATVRSSTPANEWNRRRARCGLRARGRRARSSARSARMEWIVAARESGRRGRGVRGGGQGDADAAPDRRRGRRAGRLDLVASVAVVWDFSTSGLEMGLVWLWIAAVRYVLVAAARSDGSTARRAWAASCSGSVRSSGPISA